MAYSEDHIALAAEYALGTLDAGERTQVETMMAVDTEYAAIVHAWEYRLGALNQMVGSIEPRPVVWENIKAAIGHSTGQAPSPAEEPVVAQATGVAEATGVAGQPVVAEATRTLHGVTSVYIKEFQATVENGRVKNYRVNAKVSFVLERK